jgi:hypothetical protein
MLHILVAGGFNEDDKEGLPRIEEFARLLGKEVINQGHILLNACRTSFDRIVAESALSAVTALGSDPSDRIISYALAGQSPAHNFGNVRTSQLIDWELGCPKLRIPEPIEQADAVIIVGGFTGTHRAANWARISGKPLLPVPRFAGAAEKIYAEELDLFEQTYKGRLTKGEFENLSQLTSDPAEFAQTVVSLAERLQSSNLVMVVMSFSDDPELEDAYESYKEVCKGFKYDCRRIDDESNVPRILPEILAQIAGCALVIVDLSDEKANVYYELGYADGLKKPMLVTAKKGTKLPFDVKDIPVIFWENQKGLKEQLHKKISKIAAKQGR